MLIEILLQKLGLREFKANIPDDESPADYPVNIQPITPAQIETDLSSTPIPSSELLRRTREWGSEANTKYPGFYNGPSYETCTLNGFTHGGLSNRPGKIRASRVEGQLMRLGRNG